MIDQKTIQEIKDIDIIDGISNYLQLTKKGVSYISRCPFHEEKTASLSVCPKRQRFFCFGCGESGDLLHFVMKYKNINFREACKEVCEIYRIDINSKESTGYIPKSVIDQMWEDKVILRMASEMKYITNSDKKTISNAKNRIEKYKLKYNLN